MSRHTMLIAFTHEETQYFELNSILKESEVLILCKQTQMLTRIINGQKFPEMIGQVQFTKQELDTIVPILQNFPNYAPLEEICVSFQYGYENVTEKRIEKARKKLISANYEREWNLEVRPIRNIISRTRIKMHTLDLSFKSLMQLGYILINKNSIL